MLPLSRQFIGGSSRLTLIAPVGWSNLVSRSVGSSTPSPNTSYSASADVPAPGVLPYPGPAPTSRLEAIQRLYGVKIQLSGRLPTRCPSLSGDPPRSPTNASGRSSGIGSSKGYRSFRCPCPANPCFLVYLLHSLRSTIRYIPAGQHFGP